MHKLVAKLGFSVLFLLTILATSSQALEIRHAHYEFKSTQDITRIAEHFTGKEYAGRRLILRTQSDSREGLYFILVLDSPISSLPEDASLTVDILQPDNHEPLSYSLPLSKGAQPQWQGREVYFGLTGTDGLTHNQSKPTAWRATIHASDKVLATKESFLWR